MSDQRYPFVIYPAVEGGYVAEVPALRGCLAQGEDIEETLEELARVSELWIETARKHGETLPNPEAAVAKVKERLAA